MPLMERNEPIFEVGDFVRVTEDTFKCNNGFYPRDAFEVLKVQIIDYRQVLHLAEGFPQQTMYAYYFELVKKGRKGCFTLDDTGT